LEPPFSVWVTWLRPQEEFGGATRRGGDTLDPRVPYPALPRVAPVFILPAHRTMVTGYGLLRPRYQEGLKFVKNPSFEGMKRSERGLIRFRDRDL